MPGFADSGVTSINDIIHLDKTPPQHVKLSDPIDYLPSELKVEISKHGGQTAEDMRNLNTIWQTVVARNPVIQYSLKQLATPPELRYVHDSVMSRTVSGLLSGAALLPMALGASGYASGATSIGSNVVDKAMQNAKKKADPKIVLPTDTELVELSGIIQHLQQSIVENYFAYKDNLTTLVQQGQLADALYGQYQNQQAASAEPVNQIWLKHLYQTADMARLKARQDAKRHYLVLERLIGTRGMQSIHFDVPAISGAPTPSVASVH